MWQITRGYLLCQALSRFTSKHSEGMALFLASGAQLRTCWRGLDGVGSCARVLHRNPITQNTGWWFGTWLFEQLFLQVYPRSATLPITVPLANFPMFPNMCWFYPIFCIWNLIFCGLNHVQSQNMWVKYSVFLAKSLFFLFKFPILFVKSRIWPVKSQF